MQLVEQHVISRKDPRYGVIDAAAFASKNLYNAALYEIRQAYIFEGHYLSYNEMDKRMQQHKTEGRNLLVYTDQAVSSKALKRGLIQVSMLPIRVRTKQKCIDQVRIVPKRGYYVVEVVYEKQVRQADVNPTHYAGVDLGVNNLAAIASNKPGFVPFIVNGRPAKSINQYYNKRRAELQRRRGTAGKDTRRMERLTTRRNRRLDHYLHTASRQMINLLAREGIGILVMT